MRNAYIFLSMIILLIAISSCSQERGQKDQGTTMLASVLVEPITDAEDNTLAENNQEATSDEGENVEEPQSNPIIKNMRNGEMIIKISMEQKGQYEKIISNPANHREDKIIANYNFSLNANTIQPLMVANDLSVTIPVNASPNDIILAYKNPAIYLDEDAPRAVIESNVSYNESMSSIMPNSNDFTRLGMESAGEGVVGSILVKDVFPSKFGDGRQAEIKFDYTLLVKLKTNATSRGLGNQIDSTEKYIAKEVDLKLFPVLGDKLNPFPYDVDNGGSKDLAGIMKKSDEFSFSTLKATGSKIIVDSLFTRRTGMTSKATKDELILHYNYSNDLQPEFYTDENLGGFFIEEAKNPNFINIDIIIRAK